MSANEYTPEQIAEMKRQEKEYYARIREEAMAGFADAMAEMGDVFCYGHGGYPVSYSEARKWYKRAIECGSGDAWEQARCGLDIMEHLEKVEREKA